MGVYAMKYDDGIDGPARVWMRDANMPGLAMSRSLCDTIGKQCGVTSDPEMFTFDIKPTTHFIILASDGLWEFVENQDAVDICMRAKTLEGAVQALAKESKRRWQMNEPVIDDTTI